MWNPGQKYDLVFAAVGTPQHAKTEKSDDAPKSSTKAKSKSKSDKDEEK